jgi:hypothetical protein
MAALGKQGTPHKCFCDLGLASEILPARFRNDGGNVALVFTIIIRFITVTLCLCLPIPK